MDKRNKKTEQREGTFEADIGNDGGHSQVEDAVMVYCRRVDEKASEED